MTLEHGPHARAVDEIQALLLEAPSVREFLDGVVRDAGRHIEPVAECTLMVVRGSGATVGAASSPGAERCDQAEYDSGRGPCLDAARDQVVVNVPDVEAEQRWPEWRETTLAEGFASAIAVPDSAGPEAAVSLNLYARDPQVFSAEHVVRAQSYVAELAGAVRLSLRLADQAQINADLQRAMASRSVIDQAIGVVMAQNRCGAEEAMRILRSASNHRNVKLRDVATALVESVSATAAAPTGEFVERPGGSSPGGAPTT